MFVEFSGIVLEAHSSMNLTGFCLSVFLVRGGERAGERARERGGGKAHTYVHGHTHASVQTRTCLGLGLKFNFL